MQDGMNIGPLSVDEEVHSELGGRVTFAFDLEPFGGDLDKIVACETCLADPGSCRQDISIGQSDACVPVGSDDHTLMIEQMADSDEGQSKGRSGGVTFPFHCDR